jgi:hypothetical protein
MNARASFYSFFISAQTSSNQILVGNRRESVVLSYGSPITIARFTSMKSAA